MRHRKFILSCFAAALTACARNASIAPSRLETAPPRFTVVPPEAPDAPFSSSVFVTNPAKLATPFVPDVVLVRFAPGTPQRDRQSAINAVNGTVIGGQRFSDGVEGVYYVRLPADATNNRIFAAIAALASFPQVEDALPDMLISG